MRRPHAFPHLRATSGLLLAGCVMLGGCAVAADSSPVDTSGEERSPAAATLTAMSYIPTTYRFDVTSSCGERSFLGTYRVSVRAGVVEAARPLDPVNSYLPDPAEVPSLQGMLDMAAGAGPGADVQLLQDPAGLPTHLMIDHLPDAVDDEECYEITNIRPNIRLGMLHLTRP